jgi:hypothetical protein
VELQNRKIPEGLDRKFKEKTFNSTLRSTEQCMKFSCVKLGQAALMLTCCVLISACNKEEFFLSEEFITGEDAFCFEAKSLESCQKLVDRCQPAFMPSEDNVADPVFALCIANPDAWDDVGNPGDGGDSSGSSSGSGSDSGSDSSSGADSGSDSSSGADSGSDSSSGSGSGGSGSGDPSDPVVAPTIEEAYDAKCSNLAPEYLWVKKEVSKKGTKITSKVKICHHTGNNSSHVIVIACQALKPHIKHHDDYLGACEL